MVVSAIGFVLRGVIGHQQPQLIWVAVLVLGVVVPNHAVVEVGNVVAGNTRAEFLAHILFQVAALADARRAGAFGATGVAPARQALYCGAAI